MKLAAFNAVCPFEIEDKIRDAGTGETKTITDIACIHYVKKGEVVFSYEFDNSGDYKQIKRVEEAQNPTICK